MRHRKHGTTNCSITTVTMSAEELQQLDSIRMRFHDGRIDRIPSRSLMVAVLVDWAFKHGLAPNADGTGLSASAERRNHIR